MTKRQALKLLSDMLLDRNFMKVMIAYVGEAQHLRIHMDLLRHDSHVIRFEAFQIVKIFVANPNRPTRMTKIFNRNRHRLIELVAALKSTKPDDQQFLRDQASVLSKLRALEAAELDARSASRTASRAPSEAVAAAATRAPQTSGSAAAD